MSSEGSVASSGSRIRQFGLYRTIDARTEEFLRSSRKRQIRQGCACAAISTAITVTVVVSVILVYEYSINSESNVNKKMSLKPNWIGLMNESDITSISSKFNKKINFDRTTLKLLPILLKALNKNRYLEKILEDYSSSSPPYASRDSTEATFTRNIFANSKNWLKMPSSRHYTIDYKTSPLIYWKTPTQRLDYLTKIRKIRDYQRMLNYFDKMINDKVGSNPKREFEYTENPIEAETIPMKAKKIKKIQQLNQPLEKIKNVKEFKTESKEAVVSCKCPKQLGQLLAKLVAGIQEMVPHLITNKLAIYSSCENKTKLVEPSSQFTTPQTELLNKFRKNSFSTMMTMSPIRKNIRKFTSKWYDFSTRLTTKTTRKRTSASTSGTTSKTTPSTTTSATSSTTSRTTSRTTPSSTSTTSTTPCATETIPSTTESTPSTVTDSSKTSLTGHDIDNKSLEDSIIPLPPVINSLLSNYKSYERNTFDYDALVKSTDAQTRTTKSPQKKRSTTEMFVPIKFIDSSHEVSSTEKIFDAYTVEPSQSRITVPLFREDEYDDYFVTTPKPVSEFEHLDVQSLETVKTKMTPDNDIDYKTDVIFKKTSVKLKPLNYHPVIKQNDLNLSSMRKMADMLYPPHEKISKEWKYTVEHSEPSYKSHIDPRLRESSKVKSSVESNTPINSHKYSDSLKNSMHFSNPVLDPKMEQIDMKLNNDQPSNENGEEEFQDEYVIRQPETTKMPYKYKNITKELDAEADKTANPWELLKNEEKVITQVPKSMLPSMRPIYLEVQRNNEWRQDDHADYDINFNNNIFDLPNIN